MRLLCTTLLMIIFLASGTVAKGQKDHLSSQKGKSTLGVGLGLPYGAVGIRFGINLHENINLFGGLGYIFAGPGYNLGLRKEFKSNSAAQFYLVGMYGTNAAIVIDGLSELNDVYTGATLGLGTKVNSRKKEGNYWDFGLLVPFTSSSFKEDKERAENNPLVGDFNSGSPVLIVVGYNFNLSKK